MIKKISNIDEFNKTIAKDKWLVDFSASWCGPCRMIQPILEELSNKYNIAQIDVDELPDLAAKYNIMSIPNLILFKNNEKINQVIGYTDIEELEKILNQ